MWPAVAALILAAAYFASMTVVQAARRRPLALDAALALSLLVCLEGLLLQGLSLFNAVDRTWLVTVNGVFVLGVLLARRRAARSLLRRLERQPIRSSPTTFTVAVLGALAFASAVAYRPNTWDSMTYHLARVAHWIQLGSVAPYPTNIFRQTWVPPGAEYLFAIIQTIAESDRLANFVQLVAWLVVVACAAPLSRLFGAPRRIAGWTPLLVATAPMALLQASSTQNDLVAAVMAVAIVAAAIPVLHAGARWRAADLALLILAVAAALLVKPSSVLYGSPFLVWAAVSLLRDLGKKTAWREAARAVPALAVVPLLLLPALRPLADPTADSERRPFVYSGAEQLADRFVNAARGVVREIPIPLRFLDRLSPSRTMGCDEPFRLCLALNLMPIDDVVANPLQAAAVLALLVVSLVRFGSLSSRSRAGIACLILSWLCFSAVFRDNIWLPRLHLPFLALAPIAAGALDGRRRERGVPALAAWLSLVLMTAHGALVAVQNVRRPLDSRSLGKGLDASSYYRWGPSGVGEAHDAALRDLSSAACRRLGLFIGGDSYDYPLTWRAMQTGFEVRHVLGPDDWPCAVFSDRGVPPTRPDGREWRQPSDSSLYLLADPRPENHAAR